MGESIVVPVERAVWVRALARRPGEYRIRLSAAGLAEVWMGEEWIGGLHGKVLIYGTDFVPPLTIFVDQRVGDAWKACRTVHSVEDHSAVSVIWVGADAGLQECVHSTGYDDVIVSLAWIDMDAAADLLAR